MCACADETLNEKKKKEQNPEHLNAFKERRANGEQIKCVHRIEEIPLKNCYRA